MSSWLSHVALAVPPGPARWLAAAHVLAAGVLVLSPAADLAVSAAFADPNGGFRPSMPRLHNGLLFAVDVIAWTLLFGAAAVWLASRRRAPDDPAAVDRRRRVATVVIALVLGPGLLVNAVFKEHWDRARPRDIIEFGGSRAFTAAPWPAAQCPSNCSFVSGHAAVGYFPMVVARVDPRRAAAWVAAGAIGGLGLGAQRVAVGAHFVSDVVFAYFATAIGGWLAALILRLAQRWRAPEPPRSVPS